MNNFTSEETIAIQAMKAHIRAQEYEIETLREDRDLQVESLQNRLNLAMGLLAELGCDNQWYMDQAQKLIDDIAKANQELE